jgi:hypothetical protein
VAGFNAPAPAANVLPGVPAGQADPEPAPLLPAGLAAALAAGIDEEAAATAEAVARMAAAEAASTEGSAPQQTDPEAQLRGVLKRPRLETPRDDDPLGDPSTKGGRFA